MRRKKCRACSQPFFTDRPFQVVCSVPCAVEYSRMLFAKNARKADRKRAQELKPLREVIAAAQVAFNAYIRERDRDRPCICCGKPFEPARYGGSMDAGHYLARSIAPQHRFNEDNVFGQRKNCNRPGGTTRAAFRAGVLARIGADRLAALEADTSVRKWTREELEDIKRTYAAKRRELTKGRH